MINIQFSGVECYLLQTILEQVADDKKEEDCVFADEFNDIFITFYIQHLSQDINFHELLLRHSPYKMNVSEYTP